MVEREEESIGPHQRTIERLVSVVSLPVFFYAAAAGVALWFGVNMWLPTIGYHRLDSPPFPWLQTGMSVAAFLLATMILITQNRQAKIAARRAHLDLQVNLLVDRKVGKVIQLLEEIRRDSPYLNNRLDPEAVALQVVADPVAVAESLATRLDVVPE